MTTSRGKKKVVHLNGVLIIKSDYEPHNFDKHLASRLTLRELKEKHYEPSSLGIFVHAKQKRDIQINKKAVRCTKDLKTGPKLDFEFIVTLCQKQRKESWNLPTTGVSIIFMVVQE